MYGSKKLNVDRYVIMRKLLSDIVWYRKTERIDELCVQVNEHTGRDVYLHCNDERLIKGKVKSDRKVAMFGLRSALPDLTEISEDVLDPMKVWSDMCFYIRNPRTFDLLCSSTFNDIIRLMFSKNFFYSGFYSNGILALERFKSFTFKAIGFASALKGKSRAIIRQRDSGYKQTA